MLEAYKHLGQTDELRAFWTFIAERQNTYWRRLNGGPPPWTRDPVIASRSFTNVYRVLDKASQYLIREVIPGDDLRAELVFRVLVFRTFGRIEPYEQVDAMVGGVSFRESGAIFDDYCEAFNSIPNEWPLYTGATTSPGLDSVPAHLQNIVEITQRTEELAAHVSLGDAASYLRGWPGISRFASLQYALDLNYLPFIDWDEMDVVPLGPGARWGLELLFDNLPPGGNWDRYAQALASDHMAWFDHYQLDWRPLAARPLQTVDIEHCLCEFQRYVRQRKLLAEGLEPTPFTGVSTLPQPVLPAKWS